MPLLESADPVLVPLETLLGRDDARFAGGEEPPWRGQVESRWGGEAARPHQTASWCSITPMPSASSIPSSEPLKVPNGWR